MQACILSINWRMIFIIPMLNSNITMTVRIAQIEYWLMSWYECFQNMSKDTIDNASPILVANMTFRGSERPISHALPANSCKSFQDFFIFSHTKMKPMELLLPSSRPSVLLDASRPSLLLSTKVCLDDSISPPVFCFFFSFLEGRWGKFRVFEDWTYTGKGHIPIRLFEQVTTAINNH